MNVCITHHSTSFIGWVHKVPVLSKHPIWFLVVPHYRLCDKSLAHYLLNLSRISSEGVPRMLCIRAIWSSSFVPGKSGFNLRGEERRGYEERREEGRYEGRGGVRGGEGKM